MDLYGGRPIRGAGIAIGRQDRDRFLERQHVLQLGTPLDRVEQTFLRGPGVAEDVVESIGQQLLDNGFVTRLCNHGRPRLNHRFVGGLQKPAHQP